MKRLEKGITLIALVITIIVLLILAGVSIATLFGDEGILNKARTSVIRNEMGIVTEQIILKVDEYALTKREQTEKKKIEFLLEDGYIDDEAIIQMEKIANGENSKWRTING